MPLLSWPLDEYMPKLYFFLDKQLTSFWLFHGQRKCSCGFLLHDSAGLWTPFSLTNSFSCTLELCSHLFCVCNHPAFSSSLSHHCSCDKLVVFVLALDSGWTIWLSFEICINWHSSTKVRSIFGELRNQKPEKTPNVHQSSAHRHTDCCNKNWTQKLKQKLNVCVGYKFKPQVLLFTKYEMYLRSFFPEDDFSWFT